MYYLINHSKGEIKKKYYERLHEIKNLKEGEYESFQFSREGTTQTKIKANENTKDN